MGLINRKKKFMNVKSTRFVQDNVDNYKYLHDEETNDVSQPLFIVYFGCSNVGTIYERTEYNWKQLFSSTGGFVMALHKCFALVVSVVYVVKVNSDLIMLIISSSFNRLDKLSDN